MKQTGTILAPPAIESLLFKTEDSNWPSLVKDAQNIKTESKFRLNLCQQLDSLFNNGYDPSAIRYFPEVKNKFDNQLLTQNQENNLDLKGIKEIEISGNRVNVFVTKSTSTPATISGRKIDLDYIKVERQKDKLIVKEIEKDKNKVCFNCQLYSVEIKMATSSTVKIKTEDGASLVDETNINVVESEENAAETDLKN